MSAAIEFDNISKLYRLGLVSTGTLAHDLKRWWTVNVLRQEDPYLRIGETNDRSTKGESDYVWALKDIDFKVPFQGDGTYHWHYQSQRSHRLSFGGGHRFPSRDDRT